MIDFAGDAEAIFADPGGLAVDAVFTPAAGSPVDVRVIPSMPEASVGFAESRITSATATFLMPVSSVAQVKSGDSITIGSQTYTVQGIPERNARRSFWRIDTRPA